MVHTREGQERQTPERPNELEKLDDLESKDPLDRVEKCSSWKENKIGLAFSTDHFLNWTDKHGKKQYRILLKEFTALIGTAQNFQKHFYSLAVKNGHGKYQYTVLLSDGATWIKKMKKDLFRNKVIHILDYFHLCKNVYNFAKNIFETNNLDYKEWSKNICHIIKFQSYQDAIKKIQSLGSKKLKKFKFNLINYILKNEDIINYKKYLELGFFIGSGAIESANRSVLQRRLKLPGMRWNVETGQYIVTLIAKDKVACGKKKLQKAYLIIMESADLTPFADHSGLEQPEKN